MMASTLLCFTRPTPRLQHWLAALLLSCVFGMVRAESTAGSVPQLKLERQDDALVLSVQLDLELPFVVEDALLKGIPVYFVASAEVMRERWYWANKRVASAQRHIRLSYHPLTRRWRINSGPGELSDTSQGLTLNQSFETLADAMRTIRRISYWKIADLAAIEAGGKHVVEFSFQLDAAQLPRPLQMGTQGLSDWQISLTAVQVLGPELHK